MDLRKIKKLIELVEESGIAELEVRDGVLHVQQFSTMQIKAWEISHETMTFVAYRVRGSLFHARWSRFQHYHYRR